MGVARNVQLTVGYNRSHRCVVLHNDAKDLLGYERRWTKLGDLCSRASGGPAPGDIHFSRWPAHDRSGC